MDDNKKTPQEQIAELQQTVVDLTKRATDAETRAEQLQKDNLTLQQTNQELFIRATRVAQGKDPDPETDPKVYNLEEIGRDYFKDLKKNK